MPAFWDTPATPWLSMLVIHIRSQVKTIAKNAYFEILQRTLHVTHLLKLLGKMYKYEIDPTRTVGTTERMRDGWTDGQTDERTDRRMDGQSETNIPPNNFVVWGV